MQSQRFSYRSGFTLIELLVVVAIIGILVALLMPAVQSAREAARRIQCTNNLKQIGLAILNYESTNGRFPAGSSSQATHNTWTWGFGWAVPILPYMEQQNIYDQLDKTGEHGGGRRQIGLVYNGHNEHNGRVLAGHGIPLLFCPSSPLPKYVMTWGTVPGPKGAASPMYTAVTGAIDHHTAQNKDGQSNQHRSRGIQSQGGVLLPNRYVGFKDITDGSSNTILLGEQSDFCRDQFGVPKNCRSDFGHSFAMGATPTANSDDRWFNTTTVRYKINHKSWNSTGVGDEYYACNRPIQSAHPAGAHLLLADGSVHFVVSQMDLQMLFNLSNRNDRNPVSLEPN